MSKICHKKAQNVIIRQHNSSSFLIKSATELSHGK